MISQKLSLARALHSFLILAVAFSLWLGASPLQPANAATVVVVVDGDPNWFFYDDGFPGGVGEIVLGPGTPPMGSGSVHMSLTGNARQTIVTPLHAGTLLSSITSLSYSTYRASADAGNILAIALAFDIDYDLTDADTTYQGRLTFEPYMTFPAGVPQNTWQTWNTLSGRWWASRTPGSSFCPQNSPCTWAQVLANWPNAGIRAAGFGGLYLKAGGPADGFDGNADNLTIGINGSETTYDFEATSLVFNPITNSVGVGNSVVFTIDIQDVVNLYGYQFEVNYDPALVSATGAFVNTFFDTTISSIPPSWNAVCGAGVCRFAVTKMAPDVPVTGSGTLAQVTFTGVAPGTVNLSFTNSILSTRDADPIGHTTGTATLTVYGFATIAGTVRLQGRTTPIDAGTVTLTDASSTFAPVVVNFDAATGAFSANVPVLTAGGNFNLLAEHGVYLDNALAGVAVLPGGTVTVATTTLKGGDANNDGTINIQDLTCIGNDFGAAPGTCGGLGSTDINADGFVNILDLVLPGGNYGLVNNQGW